MSPSPELAHYLAPDAEGEPSVAVRRYLEAVRAHLRTVHEESHSGAATLHTASDLMDRLTRELYARAEAHAYSEMPHRLCMLAVGGYGRREMALHSDVDLLFLHPDPLTDEAAAVAEQVQYPLWDAGLSVGCAIRTAEETCALAREDASVDTSILDARLLAGDPSLRQELDRLVDADLRVRGVAFLERQIEARQERHRKFGESLYLLQPNVKEGEGGLRDYHAALWAMRPAHPAARGAGSFVAMGLLTPGELAELERALDFLWRVRNELHWIAGRRNDQMSFAHQEKLALALGYDGDFEVELPVERFMRDYYRHARTVRNTSDFVMDQCLARVRPPAQAPPARSVEEGFRLVGDHLEIPHGDHLREKPVRLLEAFAVAQAHDVLLSRTALRLVRENLDLVDDAFRADPEAAATFLGILASERRVFRTLTALNEVGLLARYLPEWDHIVCRWQHVMYHTYTVDVHTTFLVEELRRLWRGKYEKALPEMTELMRRVEDRAVLFLGCLLHDIGKGRGGTDHSAIGVEISRACVERLGLERARADRVIFLVAQHLVMNHVAQRRDLSDPKVIVEFARLVGDRENLRNLYLLTFADTRASSPEAWTDWKGRLLEGLFERTSEFLETGSDDPSRALEQIEAEMDENEGRAREELRRLGVGAGKIDSYFDSLPRRYFVSHQPQEIARHALLVLSFNAEHGVALAVREIADDTNELILCTPDVHGLYARVAGTLTSRELNILGSTVYTLRSGLALEIYRIVTPPGGEAERQLAWRTFETTLRRVLAGEVDLDEMLRKRRLPLSRQRAPGRHPPSVKITNAESDFYTIVDATADDRMGLLYDLTRAIADQGLEIYISKATTVLDQVADTFYVKDELRRKVTDPERLERLREALEHVVAGPTGAEDG